MHSDEVKKALSKHRVKHLYHVNTVLTSLTYLNEGGLISREKTNEKDLPQTPQQSDETDKKWGIFDDIFFDSVDIHKRVKNVNHYGPVTFVYSLDVLDELKENDICVTKKNPQYWKDGEKTKDRYFSDIEELASGFVKGNFGQHITIKSPLHPIPFDCLEKIMIENPGEDKKEYLEKAVSSIKEAIEENGLSITVKIRNIFIKSQNMRI